MRKSTTKRALLMSGLAMLLSISMLVGTTFAWFTDTVSSGTNTIVAGNLDIELYHSNKEVTDEKVEPTTKLFTDVALWEPGAMVYEKFTVANLGDLALKYQFTLNALNATEVEDANGNKVSFASMLKVAVVEKANYNYDRAAILADTTLNWNPIETFTLSGELAKTESDVFGIIIYWQPSDNDNLFNMNNANKGKQVSIDLGVTLFATQDNVEADGFDSTYDENAWVEGMQVFNANDLQSAINNAEPGDTIVLMDNIVVDEPIVIPAAPATYSMRSAAPVTVIDLNGKTIDTALVDGSTTNHVYAFTNNGNLLLKNGTINARGIFNYGNLTIENITINAIDGNGGYAIRNYKGSTFTMNSGKIATTLEDDHKVDNGGYDATTLRVDEGAYAEINGGIIDNICDYTFAIDNAGEVVINGGTIKSVHSTVSTYGTMTINGGSFTCNGIEGITAHALVAWDGSNTTINGGTFDGKDNYNGFNVDADEGANVVINGGNFLASHSGSLYGKGNIKVKGGTFVDDPSGRLDNNFSAHNDNGAYIVLPGSSTEKISDGFFHNSTDSAYYITSAAGLFSFAQSVNKYSNYEYPYQDETVLLMNDIDLGGAEWTPIGDYRFSANRFCGTFDGQGYTVSNFKITKKTDKNDSNKSSYGFFGNVEGTVKNLTVANATVSSYAYCGALIGRLNSGLVENCHVVNSNVAPSYWQGGIMFGQVNGGSVKNCTVSDSSITGKSALGGMFGPVTAENGDILFENCLVKDSAIIQSGAFGGNYDKYFGGMFGYLESGNNSINVNDCTVINTTVKGEKSSILSGDNDGNIYFNGIKGVSTAEELESAIKAGGTVVLADNITLPKDIAINNANFVLDGNGYTITGSSTYALFDITGGTVAIKNVTFNGVNGSVIRTVGVKFDATNVVVTNVTSTQEQGLFRLLGESTIENCVFKNNVCSMAITLNYDGANNDPQIVKDCVFEANTCNATAVLYYVKGAGCTLVNNQFIGNTVKCNNNGATVYMGFTENNVVTGNLFMNNTVTDSNTSTRVSGGIFFGYETVFENNAFINNKASNAKGDKLGNNVCVSTYYTDIDLSGNYWGGNAPVENEDYFVQHTTYGYVVIIDDYLTSYGE